MTALNERQLIPGVIKAGLAVAFIAGLVALYYGIKVTWGILAGTGLGIGGLGLWLYFVPWALRTRRPKFWFGAAWLIKLVLLWVVLFLLITRGTVNPIGFCIGVGIIPLLFTVSALRTQKERG